MRIKPELPAGQSGFRGTLSRADQLIQDGYDKVYTLIDKDVIINQDKIKEYVNELRDRSNEIKSGKLVLVECNPCFEMWFLLHFNYTTKLYRNCSELQSELKDYISGYSKKRKYLRRSKIYEKLRPKLTTDAVPNSKRLYESQDSLNSPRYPNSRVHKIISDLDIS